jgi:hypothetical protein
MSRPIPPAVFLIGAFAGAMIAITSVIWPEQTEIPANSQIAARVNGQAIPVRDVELAMEAMARDSRNPLSEDAGQHALDRLIDEELLLQRGLELDLPRNGSGVRRAVVLAMIDTIIANVEDEPSPQDLRILFDSERALFSAEPRLRVLWQMSEPASATPSATPNTGPVTAQPLPLVTPAAAPPDILLGVTDLRNYLGASLTQHALEIDPGDRSGPIEVGGQSHWLTVLERSDPAPARFEDNIERVTALWHERAQEAALETYLSRLRDRAQIETQAFATP